jgi:hypothetical protein
MLLVAIAVVVVALVAAAIGWERLMTKLFGGWSKRKR